MGRSYFVPSAIQNSLIPDDETFCRAETIEDGNLRPWSAVAWQRPSVGLRYVKPRIPDQMYIQEASSLNLASTHSSRRQQVGANPAAADSSVSLRAAETVRAGFQRHRGHTAGTWGALSEKRALNAKFCFHSTGLNIARFILQEKLDEHADQGTSFDAFKFTSAHTFDNLLRCICSYNTDVQRQG